MAPSDAATIKTLHAKAMGLLGAGKDQEALAVFAEIVAKNANIAEVHFQIARIFLRNEKASKALTHIRAAARLKPGVADIWKIYADIVRTLSDPVAQREFRKSLKASPIEKREKGTLATAVDFTGKSPAPLGGTSSETFSALVATLTSGNAAEAEAMAEAERRRNPKSPAVLTLLAAARLSQGRGDAAEAAVLEALQLDPRYAEAHSTHARILKVQNRVPDCIGACNRALRFAPGMVAALRLRGQCHRELGMKAEALQDYESLVVLEPRLEENHLALARFRYDEKAFPEAIEVAERALKKGFAGTGLRNVLAQALGEIGRSEEALAVLEEAARSAPDSSEALGRVADMKQTLGRFDEAEADFKRAMEIEPTRGALYRVSLTSKKLAADDPIMAEMDGHFRTEALAPIHRANFGFALAKAKEDQKSYGEVFTYLNPANALMREEFPYDIASRTAHVDRLIDACQGFDWQGAAPVSKNAFAPIFVTGMPRSGTTLVEQIIASHSRVTGAGELGVASQWAQELLAREGGGAYRDAGTIEPAAFQALGDRFEAYMHMLFPEVDIVTDKSIQSFSYIGLLRRAMPNARVVVVRRDPRDNLLSIYKNVFPEGTHLYAYNIEDLAEYYRQFVRLVDFWREMVPDWFYEIQYEDLVSNPEEEARKLIAACGLDWEDACLNFHQTERRVKTLSLYQVRQPMYKSSTRAWERYGEDIRPLLDALGPDYADAAE